MLVTNNNLLFFCVSPGVVEISGFLVFGEKVKFIWGIFLEIYADVTSISFS